MVDQQGPADRDEFVVWSKDISEKAWDAEIVRLREEIADRDATIAELRKRATIAEVEGDARRSRLLTALGVIGNASEDEMRDLVPKLLRSTIAQMVWKALRPVCRECDQTAVVQRASDGAGACESHPFPSPELSVPDFAAHANAGYREASAEVAKLRKDAEQDEKAYLRKIASLEDETRCPECGCATPDDAEAGECGCDSPVCARTSTLAESYAASFAEVAKLRAENAAMHEAVEMAFRGGAPDGVETHTKGIYSLVAERDALKAKLANVVAAGTVLVTAIDSRQADPWALSNFREALRAAKEEA